MGCTEVVQQGRVVGVVVEEELEPMAGATMVAAEQEEARWGWGLGMGLVEVLEREGQGEGVWVEGKVGWAEAQGRWAEEERAGKGQVAATWALEEGVVEVGGRRGRRRDC